MRQGRTDAWIAHQLEVTVQQIEAFKRDQRLDADDGDTNGATPDHDDDLDLRAEDDAMIAAELDEPPPKRRRRGRRGRGRGRRRRGRRRRRRRRRRRQARRRRSRRGGRSRRPRAAGPLEATFDHGEEGYGLWLDPAVQDDPIYAEYWAGHRPVEVAIEEDQIIIRRAGSTNGDGDGDGETDAD